MKVIRFGVCLALYLAPPGCSLADIFRCQPPSGEVVFQATRCPEANNSPLSLKPLNVLGERLRPGEQALLADQARRNRGQSRAKRRKGTKAAQRRAAERCLAKRQKLSTVSAKLRRGYKPAQGERLRRRRDEYAEYVRRFCD